MSSSIGWLIYLPEFLFTDPKLFIVCIIHANPRLFCAENVEGRSKQTVCSDRESLGISYEKMTKTAPFQPLTSELSFKIFTYKQ